MVKKCAGMIEVDSITTLTTQLNSFQYHMMTQLNKLCLAWPQAQVNIVQQVQNWCEIGGISVQYTNLFVEKI